MSLAPLPLWAVHISDGVLSPWWQASGFVLMGALMVLGAWRLRDDEIPRIAVMAAAFFIASLIHVRVPPGSVHLLLNGLVGVVLGRRAALAIPVGLFLQAVLIGHGGFYSLGVNSCVMTLPALLGGMLFVGLHRLPGVRHGWFRTGLILVTAPLGMISLIYAVVLLVSNLIAGHRLGLWNSLDSEWANRIALNPLVLAACLIVAVIVALAERRLNNSPEFALGLLVGEVVVLTTVMLNVVVLLFGSLQPEIGPSLALVILVLHLPIVAIEGVILGFTIGFLARVKPEMLFHCYS